MARFDRCSLCDYNADTGSEYADTGPWTQGKVRYREVLNDFFCDHCYREQYFAVQDLNRQDWDAEVFKEVFLEWKKSM